MVSLHLSHTMNAACETPAQVVARHSGVQPEVPPQDVLSHTTASRARDRFAAAEHLARECSVELLGGPSDTRVVSEWLEFFEALEQFVDDLVSPNRGLFNRSELNVRSAAVRCHCRSPAAARAAANLLPALQVLDTHLARGGPYLLGDLFSLADVCGICMLVDTFRLALPVVLRQRFTSVLQWVSSCLALPAFQPFGKGLEFCTWPREEEEAFEQSVKEFKSTTSPKIPSGKPSAELQERSLTEPPPPPSRAPPGLPDTGLALVSPALPPPPSRPPPVSHVPCDLAVLEGGVPPRPSRPPPNYAGPSQGHADIPQPVRPPSNIPEPSADHIQGTGANIPQRPSRPPPRIPDTPDVTDAGGAIPPRPRRPPPTTTQVPDPWQAKQHDPWTSAKNAGVDDRWTNKPSVSDRASTEDKEATEGDGQLRNTSEQEACSIVCRIKKFISSCLVDFGATSADFSYGVPPCDDAQRGDPWRIADPWAGKVEIKQEAPRPERNAWSGYQGVCDKVPHAFADLAGCTREEFITKRIDFGLQGPCAQLSDEELFQLGNMQFAEQAEHLKLIQKGDAAEKVEVKPDAEEKSTFWDDEDFEETLFWWRGDSESLCFDLALTPAASLGEGAPITNQWWDVEKVAESDHFVAVAKPAGMFVVTSPKGLWEQSPTNFIHVAHQRFSMPSKDEPRQRGICHRLDSHTSGVQIFGKSWEAFRHFTVQNASHRVQKEYLALVEGKLGEDTPGVGLIDVPMKKWQDFARREFGSVICAREGMPAVTKYKALRHFCVPAQGLTRFWGKERWFTLVQMRILTGRTHQIRVHMAFIGHPLVGDIKYNSAKYEQDHAIVPRIFLHCLRMEFEDFDGCQFVASSDLAPDLQVALFRIQSLAEGGESPTGPVAPGIAELLRRSAHCSADSAPASEGTAAAFPPRMLPHRCNNCGENELAQCTMVQRGKNTAMVWLLTETKDAKPVSPQMPDGTKAWGPDLLWMPSEMQMKDASSLAGKKLEDATPEELGAWGAHGVQWAWAHDGVRQNGWVHFHSGGHLTSKWGTGSWKLLPVEESSVPLLLANINAVEHGLRLLDGAEPAFDMVSKRRLAFDRSLEELPDNVAVRPCAPVSCPTRGWPDPHAAKILAPRR